MIRWAIAALVVIAVAGLARAEEPPPEQVPPVARLFGEPVTRADLEERARNAHAPEGEDPDWGAVLRAVVVPPLVERYIDEHDLRATDAEVAGFVGKMDNSNDRVREFYAQRAMELRTRLDDPATPEAEREELRDELRGAERRARGEMWPDARERADMQARAAEAQRRCDTEELGAIERTQLEETIAEASRFMGLTDDQAKTEYASVEAESKRKAATPVIEWWKFNRSLYTKRGGRILFQQGGLEAFDATRAWLMERERAGDFVILDSTLTTGFWGYYRRDHGAFLSEDPEGDDFDVPWWEAEAPEE